MFRFRGLTVFCLPGVFSHWRGSVIPGMTGPGAK